MAALQEQKYYSRDLRRFLRSISPFVYIVKGIIDTRSRVRKDRDLQSSLLLLDIISGRFEDKAFDINDQDRVNAGIRDDRQQEREAAAYRGQSVDLFGRERMKVPFVRWPACPVGEAPKYGASDNYGEHDYDERRPG